MDASKTVLSSISVLDITRLILSVAVTCLTMLISRAGLAQEIAARWDVRPDVTMPDQRFGRSVAVEGDLVVVGATGDTTNGEKAGAVYVFEKSGAGWDRPKLVPPDGEPGARFGWKVDIDAKRIVVTAPWAPNPVPDRSGKIYLYEKVGETWQHEIVRISGVDVTGQMGRGMAATAGRIIVGAPFDTNREGQKAGSLVVLEETAKEWSAEVLVPARGGPDGWFGLVVEATPTRIGAGGYHTQLASRPEAGIASVFEREGDGAWTERALAPIVQPERKDHFARSIAFLGPHVFVGAEEDDNSNGVDAGGVFALRVDRQDASPLLLRATDGGPRSYFGYVIATTDRYVAASEGRDVHIFSDVNRIGSAVKLSELLQRPLRSGVSALAADQKRLVIGLSYADIEARNAGAVVIIEFD